MTLSISLTPQLENMLRAKVSSGMYNSASEVIREALRLLDLHDQLQTKKLEALRDDIREGLDSGPGRPWTADAFLKRVKPKRKKTRRKS